MDFYELDLHDDILDALDDMRFETCTPIQEHAIPPLLEGRDLIGVAQTGTGKTAAYLLPVLSLLRDGVGHEDAVNCLIMAPTRELAQQIDQAMQGFAYYLDSISSVAVYGGNDGTRYAQEKRALERGADVIIATPGRLISHLSLGNVDLSRCSFFILDEADRMLDMGFSDDIMQIAKFLPPKGERQTIMFSATMPREIQQLASTLLHEPAEVKLAVSKPADGIHQSAYVCHEAQKMGVLKHLFAEKKPERVIIFAGSKLKVKDMTIAMRRAGYNVGAMHSDLSQAERDEVMFNFKSQKIDILVATDIVARGIDIDDIQLVVNYDVPHDAEDYVHRVGRTARAGAEGRAITLISSKDQPLFGQIERFLERVIDKNPMPPELGEAPEYTGNAGRRKSSGKPSRKGKKKPRSGNKPKQSQAKSNDPKRAEGTTNKPKPSQPATSNTERAEGTPNTHSNETSTDNPSPKPRRRKHRRRPNGKGSAGQNGAATGAEQGS